MPENSKNTIIFMVLALAILGAYQFLVMRPQELKRAEEARRQAAAHQTVAPGQTAAAPGAPGAPGAPPPVQTLPTSQALALAPRVPIDTPALKGSISLLGGRIDDLYLKQFKVSLDAKAEPVELLRPVGGANAFYAELGWTGFNTPGLPGPTAVWTAPAGSALSVGHPVDLTYDNGAGLKFERRIAVDDHFMFTVTDTVSNLGQAPVTIAPYASVMRLGLPPTPPNTAAKSAIVHEGSILTTEGKTTQHRYKGWLKHGAYEQQMTGGWLGVTDVYWLTALVPPQTEQVTSTLKASKENGVDTYQTGYVGRQVNIAPGKAATETTRVFAGAKLVPLLRAYEYSGNAPKTLMGGHTPQVTDIPRFEWAVDWGMLWFITKPIFSVLQVFYNWIGNFGLAILLLTVCVKVLFFWPANKSYESITKMKKAQPQLEAIKKKYEKDPAKQQQEMMALYAKEKINPFMGCLPMLVQIPVFWSLYKVLSMSIGMRHAPFFGWIQDLSERDPTTIWNLFGLIPWDPSTAPMIGNFLNGPLHIGVWPLLMGFTMWLSQAMSPTTGMDPTQRKIMQFFPLIFTFTLSQFAAGLVIYWSWNNLLSIIQQYVIMHRYGVENPIDSAIGAVTKRFQAPQVG